MSLTAVPFTDVRLTDNFWRPRLQINHRVTLPIQHEQLGKSGRLAAFKMTWKAGDPNPPHIFWDSDVAKWIEAAAYSLTTTPDAALQALVEAVIVDIAAAQQPDGYLNLHFTLVEPEKRWTNLRDWHELYCAGHLIEAAVAWYASTGQRLLLDTLCRYADYIGTVFGPGEGQKRGYPGHEEIELALVKLWQCTGEQRYLDLACFFVDERGAEPPYFLEEEKARGGTVSPQMHHQLAYNQSHLPVRQQTVPVGHAVRALYLYCGMADVAAATGDATLLDACRALWRSLVGRRMHVTGGIGPSMMNEGFTTDYDLPDEGAYLETCAAIGLAFWAHRMLQAEPRGEYADVMERALYNGILSGVSASGDTFFYGNPLAVQPGFDGNGRFVAEGYHYRRSEWFGCACCPPNIARLLAQFPGYVYSTAPRAVYAHLYVAGQATVEVAGVPIRLTQTTDYPWDGAVTLRIDSADAEAAMPTSAWTLHLRLPGWCRAPRLTLNGATVPVGPYTKDGYVALHRTWSPKDTVRLELPMPVERVMAHPSGRQVAGKVALQRGPVVYCVEEVDNGPDLHDLLLPRIAELRVERDPALLDGAPVLRADAARSALTPDTPLYTTAAPTQVAAPLTAIPYFMWGNRQPGAMRVWLRDA